jgi:hypothetical protein
MSAGFDEVLREVLAMYDRADKALIQNINAEII